MELDKIYFFDPGDLQVDLKDYVIVETSQGEEMGEVAICNRKLPDEKLVAPLKPIIRIATEEDKKHNEENKKKEKEAFVICQQKIKKHKLDMNLLDVEYKFDNSKILFFFTADGRIDFRELVKDLAAVFKTRIELRQIGVRDEVKRIGGNGVCGRELCCCSFLGNFETVSIKMAKEQGLSLNPTKISGTCGRLMCCLKNEQSAYEELLKITPKVGAFVKTPECRGYVEEVNLITGRLKINPEKSDVPVYVNRDDVKVIKDSEIKLNRDEINALKELEDK